jgi:hypothetical protein
MTFREHEPQATILAELPHGSHFAIHCNYPASIAAATAGNTFACSIVWHAAQIK